MNKTTVAIIATCTWILLGVVLVFLKIDSVKGMPLNSIGDFLAGFFSPIAFLWLVVGYFQQGEELKLNTKALELQVHELRLSVEQQQELVEVTRADMVLSKDAYDREREKEIRQAQPVFNVQTRSYSGGHTGITQLNASIFNGGHSATRVRIECESGKISPKDMVILGADENKGITIDFAESPVQEFKLFIHYVDGLGTLRHQEVVGKKDENGNLVFLPPEEVFLTDV